jgi:hypothetical protein
MGDIKFGLPVLHNLHKIKLVEKFKLDFLSIMNPL